MYRYLLVGILMVAIAFSSCKSTRMVPDGSYLLNKRKIKIDNNQIDKDVLATYIKQKTNRKLLGIWRFHLGAYNLSGKRDGWIRKTIGEAPVIYDSTLTNISVKQVRLYLNNKGYFKSIVSDTVIYKRKKANLTYRITTGPAYRVRNWSYDIEDRSLHTIFFADTINSLVKSGVIFDIDLLQSERDRITNLLRDNGYFDFIKEYISFHVDSAISDNVFDVKLLLRSPSYKLLNHDDSIVTQQHKQYMINKVLVYPEYSTGMVTDSCDSTIFISKTRRDVAFAAPYTFIHRGKMAIDPSTIAQSIFVKQNELYSITDVQQTYRRLSELSVFKYINISFEKALNESDSAAPQGQLNCKVYLARLPKQSIAFETEGTNSGGDLGIAANISYQNKNIFKAAEILEVRLKGALEVQNIDASGIGNKLIFDNLPFNTFESGLVTTIKVPRFVVPIRETRFPKYFRPRTIISGGLNYQKRPDYTRYMSNFVFGYEWKESRYKKHLLNPIDFSGVSINRDSLFTKKINALNDMRIRSAYSDHLTPATSYSFTYNNQQLNKTASFSFFRVNAEIAGNLLYLIQQQTNSEINNEGGYNIFGIKFAQYIRLDVENRFYKVFDERNRIVFRQRIGAGLPFNNAYTLPFEKAFYSGGANSIRGWQLRSLGPGSYTDTLNIQFDKTGEIILEANVEYRFPLYKFLNGALFVDMGNVWLRHYNENYEGGEFNLSRFYKELALDYGLGIRFDFNYFIIRLDAAMPAYNPAYEEGDRWMLRYAKFKRVNYNIGIGYPF